MERQIVDLDPGKNYNAAICAGDPHFEMEKINIHRSLPNRSKAPNCNARWYSSVTQKSCSVLIKYESPITQKCLTAR